MEQPSKEKSQELKADEERKRLEKRKKRKEREAKGAGFKRRLGPFFCSLPLKEIKENPL